MSLEEIALFLGLDNKLRRPNRNGKSSEKVPKGEGCEIVFWFLGRDDPRWVVLLALRQTRGKRDDRIATDCFCRRARGLSRVRLLPRQERTRSRDSGKHLPAYLDEMTWRFDNRKKPFLFRDAMLRLIHSDNLEYKELISSPRHGFSPGGILDRHESRPLTRTRQHFETSATDQ
jgi:hypothetical protein